MCDLGHIIYLFVIDFLALKKGDDNKACLRVILRIQYMCKICVKSLVSAIVSALVVSGKKNSI